MASGLVINVNGKPHTVQAAPDTALLYVLRNELGLHGPQFGCGLEQCGACMVLFGAEAKQSCKLTVAEVGQTPITTLEGLNEDGQLHPVVRTHPVTGRKALYLNDEMTVGIEGMPDAEAVDLLHRLCAEATRPDRVLRYRWRRGDIVIWDNPSVLHAATFTDPAQARTLYRLTIKGTEPF